MRNNSENREDFLETRDIPVQLLTATRSKGLEFDAVVILDADSDEWPNHMTDDIEEERRLFYVALSRARRYLYFVTSGEKLVSRFLLEGGVDC